MEMLPQPFSRDIFFPDDVYAWTLATDVVQGRPMVPALACMVESSALWL